MRTYAHTRTQQQQQQQQNAEQNFKKDLFFQTIYGLYSTITHQTMRWLLGFPSVEKSTW